MDDRSRLTGALRAVPPRLADSARRAAARPTAPGEWTPSEVVRHLIAVDLEVWQPRLAQLEAEDHPIWAWVEPDRWTGEPDASLERLIELHDAVRGSTVATLAAMDHAGWARTGTHATFGVVDVGGLMARAIDHDEEHLSSFAE